jgi:D-alanine-D-alanine ligase
MSKKLNIAILFGGKSAEHEVSINSARNIVDAMDKEKYNPILIKISKDGCWTLDATDDSVIILPNCKNVLTNISNPTNNCHIDVVFPVLHGTYGEDGTVQGLLKIAEIPFVGAGVLGSAVGMDKDVMKRLLRDTNLPIGKFMVLHSFEATPSFHSITSQIGLPFFVKPANMGSSVGISKVHNETEYALALKEAFIFDHKIIIEEFIDGREIECSVLGNHELEVSVPGEIISNHEFYSYDAKYIDDKGTKLDIPAKLSQEQIERFRLLSERVFQVLNCSGLARVDFFLKNDGQILVNEINTLPGFTKSSMYPKLWEASGINYPELIDRLIKLAIEKFHMENKLNTSYS